MPIVMTIECDPEIELVARTLYAYNSYPGQKPREIPWPPKLKQQISHYLRLAEAVVRAQKEERASQEVFMIGEYRADYSGLTEAEIAAAQPPELEELYRNSIPVNRRDTQS